MEVSFGFFTHLFHHFLALLSAFGLTISPTQPPQKFEAFDSGPPGVVRTAAAPGLSLRQQPLLVRIVETQLNGAAGIGEALAEGADDITNAIVRVPRSLQLAIDSRGLGALPGAAANSAAGIVGAVGEGTTDFIATLAAVINSELALLGGGAVRPTPSLVAIQEPEGPLAGGPLEIVVRLPRALAVAGQDLVRAGADAAIIVVRAVSRAVTDVLNAVARPPAAEFALAREEVPPPRSVPEALTRAPVTIANGFVDAGARLRQGTRQASDDFTRALRPQLERALVADNLDNTVARAGANNDDTTVVAAGITAGNDAKAVAVKPNRPRPVLGAIKAVTGTIKAVSNGIRTALGLPPRKRAPAPQPQKEVASAPTS